MNPLEHLLQLPADEKARLGILHTPAEIRQQPSSWRRAVRLLREQRGEAASFLERHGLAHRRPNILLLAGAGSSEFVGISVAPLLRRRLGRQVLPVATTQLVTHAAEFLIPGYDYLMVSFARSGNSPESSAAFRSVRQEVPALPHVIVTCNADGELARLGRTDPHSLCLVLPEETNDRSLVMTSSFSTMALVGCALAYLNQLDALEEMLAVLETAVESIFHEYAELLAEFAGIPFERACFLGSGSLQGAMKESALKMQEMTDGRVVAQSASYLGLRHGPQVFVDGSCAVVASLAGRERVQRYELDLLRELREKEQGCATLVIGCSGVERAADWASHIIDLKVEPRALPDEFRILSDVVVGQLLGMFKSLELGLRPDNPSTSGIINRVVQGVVIYE